MKDDCWSSTSNATCSNKPGCKWKSYSNSGWCEEVNCWTWDSMKGGNESLCQANSYGLSCTWSGMPAGNKTNGWCYKNINTQACSNITTERGCIDTYYCWWQFNNITNTSAGGQCKTPGDMGTSNISMMLNEWNPKCYIFDMNATECNNTIGCNFSTATSKCLELDDDNGRNITVNGINCSFINSSLLCNSIPMLSSCCAWMNGSCTPNKMTTSCWSQMQAPPAGAAFCEDYNSYTSQSLCEQIAGTPWYMPCKWDNSTETCQFDASDVFGNDTKSLVKIENKKNCEAAGGKWITENYCEGNLSVPTGKCEYKFDEESNCDKACYGCEIKDSNGNAINSTNAQSACENSRLGYCEFRFNNNSPNGIGTCKAKDEFRSGVAKNCDTSCGDCSYKGEASNNDSTKRPSYYCVNSKANSANGGCKWIVDNTTSTGGICVEKGDKTCEDACDRCTTQTKCQDNGRTSVSNQSGSCKWQGDSETGSCVNNIAGDAEICWDAIDNNNNGLIDCGDPSCYADSWCGITSGDCFGWTDNATCIAKDCEWVIDKWGSWCDFKGSQCWKYTSNESDCNSGAVALDIINISEARLEANNINTSKTFNLSYNGKGWVVGSFNITTMIGLDIAGNYTINYTTQRISFLNNTFMVEGDGAGNGTNISYAYYLRTPNCQWTNGSGNGWCEKDFKGQEVCMGLNRTACRDANESNCNWSIDTWCNSSAGSSTTWCQTSGGWCDNNDLKPKNCWTYTSGSTECNSHSGCSWKSDSYSQPHCEMNYSANCWSHTSNSSCSDYTQCIWSANPQGGGWCSNRMEQCYTAQNETACAAKVDGNGNRLCYYNLYMMGGGGSCSPICFSGNSSNNATYCNAQAGCYWKENSGWCEEYAPCMNSSNSNNATNCAATSGCRWKSPGWCDPKNGGFSTTAGTAGGGAGGSVGGDCYKYDGNQTMCTNKSIINITCGWNVNQNPMCEVDWSKNCWQYTSIESGCNTTNGCWFKNDSMGSFCTNVVDQCWQNQTLQNNATKCAANPYCFNNSWGGCEGKCFSQNSTTCNLTFCKWSTGWCTSATMNKMFENMESGAPAPLGNDICNENISASVDICGFGMKAMGESYGFGAFVRDFSNASACNKEKLSSYVMGSIGGGSGGSMIQDVPAGAGLGGGTERIGSGNETVIYIVYLDTDGMTSGGCTLDSNTSSTGYEFRFKYTSEWNSNTSKASETFNSYKCDNSNWKATDIKISAWNKKMCSEIGGPMIAVGKSDLAKYPTLYNSTKDMRVFVATIGRTGNISSPSDTAGPGWITPGSVDFEIVDSFAYNSNSSNAAKYEDILKKGYVQYEDCFNGIDDDSDGNIDCNDWNCQYASNCEGKGVNNAGYNDTSSPQVIGIKIEEYPDAALIMYDTNKPTNGTLELYGYGDSQCVNRTSVIGDIGVLSSNVRDYKLWHYAMIYNDGDTANNLSLDWPLVAGNTYYYKLRICDNSSKCAVSKCSSFKAAQSAQKCGYCNFVTRIKAPTGWTVSYDVDRDGTYEHIQGQMCGPNAGMKTNYTIGRKVNVKLAKDDGSVYFEFINASLTKTGLNDKVRTISSTGDIIADSDKIGLTSETRDKIINNLHPEICRIKVPFSGTCDKLYHCNDSGENCTDRTTAAGGQPINATSCLWNAPYCEFSAYRESLTTTTSTSSSSSGGGGGGGGAAANCTENWTCAEWSACTDGKQTRVCSDANSCGTIENRPKLEQTCESATGSTEKPITGETISEKTKKVIAENKTAFVVAGIAVGAILIIFLLTKIFGAKKINK